ncbi:MAG: cell wall assembly protein [Gammaproteobacteria bacterium CG22_combo_CG10-13_8_21_14_all_40_8]|nr:MAG: cell wall assembly protein [Gammaproteobacteria bacterium CG22_combo_CG10-13_8_21_14_all_40_8]
MDEVLLALQQKAIPQMVSSDLPDEDDLVELEEQILLPIPASFKEFLMTTSDLVIGSLEPVTAGDPQLHTYLPEVTSEAWANGLPRYLLPLCLSGDLFYCVAQSGEVQLWIDGEPQEETWDDVWHWAQMVWLES